MGANYMPPDMPDAAPPAPAGATIDFPAVFGGAAEIDDLAAFREDAARMTREQLVAKYGPGRANPDGTMSWPLSARAVEESQARWREKHPGEPLPGEDDNDNDGGADGGDGADNGVPPVAGPGEPLSLVRCLRNARFWIDRAIAASGGR